MTAILLRPSPTTLFGLLLGAAISNACSLADHRPAKVRDYLTARVTSESGGALALHAFTKTNGYQQELMGMKMYVLEWQVEIEFQREAWKAGNALVGYWDNFGLTLEKPGFWQSFGMASAPKLFEKGTRVRLGGQSTLLKTDQGWRVESSDVQSSQIIPPPDNPTEGRSTDIQAFWNAFRQAVATKNPEAVAKFVRFPLRIQETPMVQESEFRSQPALWDGTVLQPLLDAVSPTKVDERWYKASGSQFSVYFQKDQDGYWKWTHYDHGSLLMDEGETPKDVVKPIPPQ